MRILAALGGNALLRRGEWPDASLQQRRVRAAVDALAPIAEGNQLVVTHGNGPQVGLLALESAGDRSLARPYPLDVLGAQTQGMIGYWLLQALQNGASRREVAVVVTQTLVSAADPAFANPTKFVGPVYSEAQALQLTGTHGWVVRRDGDDWRRVVPSPQPHRVVETRLIRRLLDAGAVVVCAGGGGVPVIRDHHGELRGVEAVVDKDATAGVLAEDLEADVLLLLTDVAAVETDHGTSRAKPIPRATPTFLRRLPFAAGSMGPKVEAACRFVEMTGNPAAIGAIEEAAAVLSGKAGTMITSGANHR